MPDFELIIVEGTNKNMKFLLNPYVTTIGRSDDNHIVLDDDRLSRHHCVIEKHSGHRFQIKDLDSTNGTYINEELVKIKELVIGDEIRAGNTVFLFATVEDTEKILLPETSAEGTKIIRITEMKVAPEYSRILDSSTIGNNLDVLRKAHRDLTIVYNIATMINSIQETRELLNVLADRLVEVIKPDRLVLMVFDNGQHKTTEKVVRVRSGNIEDADNISMSMVEEAVTEGMAILSYDALTDDRFKSKQSVIINRIRSAICVPLKTRDKVLGVLYIDTHISVGKFSEQDLQFLSIICNQASIAIQNAKLYEDLDDLFTGSLKTLVAIIEAKDSITSGHSIRVTGFSLAIGEELKLNKETMRNLKITGLLHDIGKVGIPESILGKSAPLNENEAIRMKEHAERGAKIIKNIKNVGEVVSGIRHHHERYDGSGIPDGLKGENIPIISRIIAVADTFDAMASDRPYRKGISTDKILQEIENCTGSQFDPMIVNAFLKIYNEGKLNNMALNYFQPLTGL